MTAAQLADKYQYSLPYTRQDIINIYEHAYRQALTDVLHLASGEVINGSLKAMIDAESVKGMLDG